MIPDGVLAPMAVADRAPRLREALAAAEVDALLVTDLTNVRYLTGFTGSAGRLLVTAEALVLTTDGRYADQAPAQAAAAGVDVEVAVGATLADQDRTLAAAVPSGARLGLEAASVTWADLRRYEREPFGSELVPTEGLVEAARAVKDVGEVDRLARAAAIADAALTEVAPRLLDRPTETEVGLELDFTMRRLGADDVSFETIVASGPNGAVPHHRPDDRTIVPGDLVVIDFGALVEGYHSDMTRSYVIGEPNAQQRELYDLLLRVQFAGLAAVRAGVPARQVDAVCRQAVADAGYAAWYLHSTGHGVGLQIHEDPFESPTSTLDLRAGDVVTVEPGLYRVGFGGFRIEDLVVVTDSGCQILTHSPKDTPDVPCPPSPPTT